MCGKYVWNFYFWFNFFCDFDINYRLKIKLSPLCILVFCSCLFLLYLLTLFLSFSSIFSVIWKARVSFGHSTTIYRCNSWQSKRRISSQWNGICSSIVYSYNGCSAASFDTLDATAFASGKYHTEMFWVIFFVFRKYKVWIQFIDLYFIGTVQMFKESILQAFIK